MMQIKILVVEKIDGDWPEGTVEAIVALIVK